jgi:nucleoside-diphosphate-sugar epimerase
MKIRVLVTGATGFLGSHLVELLSRRNILTCILIRPESDTWRIRELLPKTVQIHGDLARLEGVREAIREFAPDAVVHVAWRGAGNRYRNEVSQFDNLHWSLRLLRLAGEIGAKHWIGIGSQAEYGRWNKRIHEKTPNRPTTLYGIAKLCTCLMSRHLCRQLGLRFVWLRLFAAYGPKDDPGWLIPYVILTLLRGQRPALTEGAQCWDYLYISDVVDAIYLSAVTSRASGIFNLGSGKAYSIRGIAERIRDMINPTLPLGFGEVPYSSDQIMHLEADISRLQRVLRWSPRVSLEEGLARTVEWYRGQCRELDS